MSTTEDQGSDLREFANGKLVYDEPRDQVARLRIVNPDKRGALDQEILDAFATEIPKIDARCLVITGSDEVFSAGYDIGGLPQDRFAEEAEKLVAHPFTAAITAIERFPFPSVAALNGHTIGGGLELALACDLRVATASTKLGMPPAKLGLVYSHKGLDKFIQVIGPARTRELFFTARNIDADRALEWGLINDISLAADIEEVSLKLAATIAGNAPLSLSGNKQVIEALLKHTPLDPGVEAELVELRRRCFLSDDFREGVRAFGEKRPPRWSSS
ncbi:MAG TPA: enoyl-CoA hydratase-related protein [Solirubrobacterales bacterium]|jgi:enoyl-CoA hydratase/carnithine racemase|nr:enoyl-CoA hydratase-related protein [Solirubrobacterales bacterium]